MPAGRLTDDEKLCLLAEHEPVLAFTEGEMFLPVDAERYIECCALWSTEPDTEPREIVAAGALTVERLVAEDARRPNAQLQLRFVDGPLRGREYRHWRRRPDRPRLHNRGRFTKVGVLARFIDALFRIGLLLRGRIPGGFAAAADARARQIFGADPPVYHGRVVEDGGYLALQYWYFYVMNDWRSTFAGVNDHEADWELVTVYLVRDGDEVTPRWLGVSTHDDQGDDLRRRWDDPDLTFTGGHPVVHVGAGSHSGAVLPGDYVVAVDPPILRPAIAAFGRLAARIAPRTRPGAVGFRIPYVDYKRGDGPRVGPGQGSQWERVLIDDETPWVRGFRGLWGLDTGDRFGGERAPAGPRFERSGAIRRSWADPTGWVGLHKVPPTDAAARTLLEEHIADVERDLEELDRAIPAARDRLRRHQILSQASGDGAPGPTGHAATELSVAELVARRAELDRERRLAVAMRDSGLPEPGPHDHLHHRAVPWATERSERDRFLRIWATVSSPLLIAALVVALLRPPGRLIVALGVLLLGFFAVEAVARRRALLFVRAVAIVLGAVAIAVGLAVVTLNYWRVAASIGLGVAALALLALNVSDLRRR